MDIQEKINALMEEAAFAEAFKKVTGAEDVVALFAARGITVPMALAQELFEHPAEEELGEEALEEVSGGGPVGSALGSIIGNGIYYGAGYLGARLAGWDKKKSKAYAKKCGTFGKYAGGIIGAFAPA